MILEIGATVGLLGAVWVWKQRVPKQNLVLAAGLIVIVASALRISLFGLPRTWISVPWLGIWVSLAAIPIARLVAEKCCRAIQTQAYYGVWLTMLATTLAALPIGFAFRGTEDPSGSSPLSAGRYWIHVLVGCLGMFLVTLPCWLDKRQVKM